MLLIYVLCLIHDITKNLFFYLLLFPHRGFKKKQGWYFVQNICIEYTTKYNVQLLKSQSFIFLKLRQCILIFTNGELNKMLSVTRITTHNIKRVSFVRVALLTIHIVCLEITSTHMYVHFPYD